MSVSFWFSCSVLTKYNSIFFLFLYIELYLIPLVWINLLHFKYGSFLIIFSSWFLILSLWRFFLSSFSIQSSILFTIILTLYLTYSNTWLSHNNLLSTISSFFCILRIQINSISFPFPSTDEYFIILFSVDLFHFKYGSFLIIFSSSSCLFFCSSFCFIDICK